MATVQSTQWATGSPYLKFTVNTKSETATTITLGYTAYYVADTAASSSVNKSYTITIGETEITGTFAIGGKTGSNVIKSGEVTISKQKSVQTISTRVSMNIELTWGGKYKSTISTSLGYQILPITNYKVAYNANGGTGAPNAQTKFYNETLVLSSSKPTRDGYTFQGWATSSTGAVAYQPSGNYTSNAAVTLYAIWKANTYTVKFNANGGTGGPTSQTKTAKIDLTLTTSKPARTGYTFLGWSTSSSSTTPEYLSGGKYTNDASVTLYAVWEKSYQKPRIIGLTIDRCNSSTDMGLNDNGKYAVVSFTWECDGTNPSGSVKYRKSGSTGSYTTKSITLSGTTGTVKKIYGSFALEDDYEIVVTVTDSGGSTEVTQTLQSSGYIIDILKGGEGIAFGKIANLPGTLDVNYALKMAKGRYVESSDFGSAYGDGYVRIATIKVLNGSKVMPIFISYVCTNDLAETTVALSFSGTSVATYYAMGNSLRDVYLNIADASVGDTYEVYVARQQGEEISITNFSGDLKNLDGVLDVDFPMTHASTIPMTATKLNFVMGIYDQYGSVSLLLPTRGVGICGLTSDGEKRLAMNVTLNDNLSIGQGFSGLGTETNIYGDKIYLRGASYSLCMLTSYLYPSKANAVYLGSTSYPWNRLYSYQSVSVTSDRDKKKNIMPLGQSPYSNEVQLEDPVDMHSELFDRLQPVQYQMKEGDEKLHFGLIAQDVISAAEESGFDPDNLDLIQKEELAEPDPNGKKEVFGLVYNDLIAMLIHEVQKLKKKVNDLEDQINGKEEQVN